MSFSEFSFGFWRVMQIIILMPALGMLGWFADRFTDRDAVTPRYTLIPFVASILALAWNAGTLFLYKQTKYSGGFVAFIDLLFAGVFIGAVHGLRLIIETNYPSLFIDVNKPCAMLEGWFAYGITNCIVFFINFLSAFLIYRHYDSKDRVVVKHEMHILSS